ncbi:glucose-6-phosphate isomerase [Companilactobacillus paralimentarius DSM 13238 = JCM 10415]|jgi:Glucose-6-phosphate isomerase|uniref:Glucose-6-phosphate isomerase n=3 Tax=Companilactobacillus TaxID=2767879 RepID=A0ABR5NR79_9LACO|nr:MULTISPECIES: glucose-6-phosphate isomerase [Companilactobacillus]KAE9556814.1 glucose-6-phosphate isomerase [Companilactobacillus paralimentarius]KAE9557443.1 glucose-6-phosphate isomerase [Companilactobacillus kimchii]KRK50176.1 glucose-6-phosphate isomerase [Companilactobacillus kimchii DSM 13961 = JCM 10707]KRL31140.1 glucose-6-phosphate isomerase [Companilactobacillus paralimentarius DSM 13238 = JCM 10415]MDR4933543.1 glucose-6-phosphate isomerase [Companilactobacillus paralimentarius]
MTQIKFDDSKLSKFVHENEVGEMQALVTAADDELRKGTGAGADFRGFIDLPVDYDKDEFARIKKAAKKIQSDSEVFVGIGIGGSYLGARAAIDFLSSSFYNVKNEKDVPEVYFCGNSISPNYLADLLDVIGDRDFSINVISKSGTTTEPSIAFRILKAKLIEKYGVEGAKGRIYATTDRAKGALKTESDAEGYEEFVVPDDIGGRFSVLTAVGLLPIAVAGIDIDKLMEGAAQSREDYSSADLTKNDAYKYAALRNILYRKGYTTELLENYEPNVQYFGEWWKQLMGESEGKDQKGIYPSSANFSTDLHSLGQYIQEGRRNLMETVVLIDQPRHDVKIPAEKDNLDGLKYLENKSMDFVNKKAYEGVVLAHTDGGVPVMTVHIEKQDAYNLGYLMYFFEIAVGISGYLNGINPFNQPGVEAYKKNMFGLLGRPGYEELGEELNKRL